MTVTFELNPEVEQGLLTLARKRGVSWTPIFRKSSGNQVRVAVAQAARKGEVPGLPTRRPGAVAALHRRDIYDDVG